MRKFWTAVGTVVVATALLVQPLTAPAFAANYPSWTDVLNARHNVAAKKKAIAQLQAMLAELTAKAEAAQAEAERLGAIFQEAQDAFDEAAYKADQLQAQADEAEKTARRAADARMALHRAVRREKQRKGRGARLGRGAHEELRGRWSCGA